MDAGRLDGIIIFVEQFFTILLLPQAVDGL
jgi:hypothetical protein